MNKKWVLYIGGFEMPDRNAAAQRVIANAKVFRILGYDTFFIGLSKTKDFCKTTTEFEGFYYINLPYPCSLIGWVIYLSSIKPYLTLLNKQPDIIIAYNFPAFALERLRKWSSKHNIPLIADCTEWYEANGNILFRLFKNFDTKIRMEKIHPKLDGIITISQLLTYYYKDKMENVIMVPPLVDQKMKKWVNNIDDTLFCNNNIVKIIYAGSPGNGNKDKIDMVLKVLSQIKMKGISNFQFSIIGITEKQFNKLFNTSVPLNIKMNVIFKGRLTHTDTINEIKLADFYLFLREDTLTNNAGFPTKFVESISCGTPVLTNATSDLKNYISEGNNGFIINSLSYDSIEDTLAYVLQLPKEKITLMKKWCLRSYTFHYEKFISDFELLVSKLN